MDPSLYRALPGVDTLLAAPVLRDLPLGAELKAEAARAAVSAARERLATDGTRPDAEVIAADAARRARLMTRPSLRPVINATGVIVHTNLGRAPLPSGAVDAALGACNLEYDLVAGARGSRRAVVEELLRALSGAEAALVVSNNAAAVVLMLATVAHGRQVAISRSELVEIGGSFRVPDIMACSGAVLREVGTTNRTYARDYAQAVTPETAAILRVHPSNFAMVGFTHRPTVAELAQVAKRHGLMLLYDMGTGTFGELPPELRGEGDVRGALAAGAHVVSFSGDKLLGGPQAGIVLGEAAAVDAMARHPLARAFRADKLTLAALEHVLMAYRRGRPEDVPVWRMLHADANDLSRRARVVASALQDEPAKVAVTRCDDAVGGGSHPGRTLSGMAVTVQPDHGSVEQLASALRGLARPVVATLSEGALWLHMRTVAPEDDEALVDALRFALA